MHALHPLSGIHNYWWATPNTTRGKALPPAIFATIDAHVWLLEKTRAPTTFRVVGHDREVPLLWVARYGSLLGGVVCYVLVGDGRLEVLTAAGLL